MSLPGDVSRSGARPFLVEQKGPKNSPRGKPLGYPRFLGECSFVCQRGNSPSAVAVRCQMYHVQLRLPPHERRKKQTWWPAPLNNTAVAILLCSSSERVNDRRSAYITALQAGENPKRGYAPICVVERGGFSRGRENRNSLPLERPFGTFPAKEKCNTSCEEK